MRTIALTLCCFLLLTACKKENELEGVELGKNKFDGSVNSFVTISSAIQINCTTIRLNISANDDLVPDTEQYDHFLIAGSSGDTSITQKTRNIFIAADCDSNNEYKIALYHFATKRSSFPTTFFFKTNP